MRPRQKPHNAHQGNPGPSRFIGASGEIHWASRLFPFPTLATVDQPDQFFVAPSATRRLQFPARPATIQSRLDAGDLVSRKSWVLPLGSLIAVGLVAGAVAFWPRGGKSDPNPGPAGPPWFEDATDAV